MRILKSNKNKILIILAMCFMMSIIMISVSGFIERQLRTVENTNANMKNYKYHVAMIGSSSSDEFWKSVYEGCREAGEDEGVYIENFGEKLAENYSVRELFEMAVAAKVDGIIVFSDGDEELKEQMREASKQGIPVMTILKDVADSGRISFASGNDYTIGELYGNQIIEEAEKKYTELGRKIRVSLLTNLEGKNTVPNLVYTGIHEKISSIEEKIEFKTSVLDDAGKFESEETVRELLLDAEPPDIIVCLSTVDTISAYQSVVDYNRVGKTSIIGWHSAENTLEGIQKGIIKSSIFIDANELGKKAADGMCDYLEDGGISEYLTVRPVLIDQENVESYMEDEERETE